jgi:hypothetical protein
MKNILLILIVIAISSCKNENQSKNSESVKSETLQNIEKTQTEKNNTDTIEISKKHKINKIICDLDGDKLDEIVEIVKSTKSGKSGLRIVF